MWINGNVINKQCLVTPTLGVSNVLVPCPRTWRMEEQGEEILFCALSLLFSYDELEWRECERAQKWTGEIMMRVHTWVSVCECVEFAVYIHDVSEVHSAGSVLLTPSWPSSLSYVTWKNNSHSLTKHSQIHIHTGTGTSLTEKSVE